MRLLWCLVALSSSLQVVEGGFVSRVRSVMSEAIELRRRRDDEITAVSSAQLVSGLWLCFLSVPEEENRWALGPCFFVTLKFYERLLASLVLDVESLATPGERLRNRAAKRFASVVLFAAAMGSVNYSDKIRDMVPALALGCAFARSWTAVADYAATETSKELAVRRAVRGIVPKVDGDDDYLDAAREAVRKVVLEEQKTHVFEAPPIARFVVLIFSTYIVSRIVQRDFHDSIYPFDILLSIDTTSTSLEKSAALFAPCVVGAFEVARAGKKLLNTNEYLLHAVTFTYATKIFLAIQRPALFALASVLRVVGLGSRTISKIFDLASRLSRKIFKVFGLLQKVLFGSEYFFYDLMHPEKSRLRKCIDGLLKLREQTANLTGIWGTLVKKTEANIRNFLTENHDALWPWVAAVAAFKYQTGAISLFPGIPRFLAEVAALPSVTVAKYSVKIVEKTRAFITSLLLQLWAHLVVEQRKQHEGNNSFPWWPLKKTT